MKTCFIFNPTSGRNLRRPGLSLLVRDFIAARSLDATFEVTEGRGHATELARAAVLAGHGVVVAVGGDGTVNEVAQGIVNTPAALALVPCGSGNGLARHLELPRSLSNALELSSGAGGRVVTIDTGTANGRPFFNAMGLGLDAEVSQRFNGLTHRGLPAYARVAVTALREMSAQRCEINAGSRSQTLDVLLVAVANSDQYGNNARIAPGARVNDGCLDLVAVKAMSLLRAVTLVPRLFLGNFDQSADVVRLTGPRFLIRRAAAGLIHTDGETHHTTRDVEVVVQPRSLRVVIPILSRAVAVATNVAATRFALQFP